MAYVENLTKPDEMDGDEPDWEIDMVQQVWRKLSNRPTDVNYPAGTEMPLEDRLAMYHPDDEPRVRANLQSLYTSQITVFNYSARINTREGVKLTGAFIRVIRDESGQPLRLLLRYAPPLASMTEGTPEVNEVQHEGWVYDVKSGLAIASDAVNRLHGLECGVPHPRDLYGKIYRPGDWVEGMKVLDEVAAGIVDTSFLSPKLDPSDAEGVMVTAHGIRGKNGQVVRVIGYRSRYLNPRHSEFSPAHPRIGFWAKKLRPPEFIMPDEDFCKIYRVDLNSPSLDADIESRAVQTCILRIIFSTTRLQTAKGDLRTISRFRLTTGRLWLSGWKSSSNTTAVSSEVSSTVLA